VAKANEWIQGARPKTLPAAVAPVLVGTALAFPNPNYVNALLALIVSLSLQIGVNFANDYSDGIRGTDAERVGPLRLVGSGLAKASAVRNTAFSCFLIAAIAGLYLSSRSSLWLILIGALAIGAAWGYTGGNNPYGYRALGEVSVFLFFGVVAVLGTYYVQSQKITFLAICASFPIGAFACAILVMNNLRDRAKDLEVGKKTLAVRLGDRATRILYLSLLMSGGLIGALTAISRPWALLVIITLPVSISLAVKVLKGAGGRDLIPLLQRTALIQLLFAFIYSVGLAISA
jgi:1,4-dihydroxy-2-naphthoate octaprenyltransferase